MPSRNICKFINSSLPDKLEVTQYILESDLDTMKNPYTFHANRAILITSGEGLFQIGSRQIPFHPGCLIFVLKEECSYVISKHPCEYMYITFDGMRAEELFLRFHISANNRCFDSFEGLIPLWRDTLSRASEETIDLAAESILLYTFSRLKEFMPSQNNLINRIVQLTEERFTDSSLSVETLAAELNYNAKYISHQFKLKMGIGYIEYLRNVRIKYAVTLFDHGIDSIKSVAALSGFSDPAYFSIVFKNAIGCSPKEYISLQKNRTQQ